MAPQRPIKKGQKSDILTEEYATNVRVKRAPQATTPKVDRRQVSEQAAVARTAEEERLAHIKAETRDDMLLMFKAAGRNENVKLSAIRGKSSKRRRRTWADRVNEEEQE